MNTHLKAKLPTSWSPTSIVLFFISCFNVVMNQATLEIKSQSSAPLADIKTFHELSSI